MTAVTKTSTPCCAPGCCSDTPTPASTGSASQPSSAQAGGCCGS